MLIRNILLTLTLMSPMIGWAAQWELVEEQMPFSARSKVPVALVRSEAGDSFRVYVDDTGTVRGMFSLRAGMESLSETSCPTYQIDDRSAVVVTLTDGPCELETRRAHFSLGEKTGRRIRSTRLHRLMNGSEIIFSFRLEALGYRQSVFSLRRSKYAVEGAMGRGVVIEKE